MINIKLAKNLNEESKKDIFEKIYYVSHKISKVVLNNKNIKIYIKAQKKEKKEVRKKIIKLISIILKNSEKIKFKTIFENKIKLKGSTKSNNFNYLKKNNFVKKISDGVYSFEGKFLDLKNKIDKKIKGYSKKNNYKDVQYSGILPVKSLIENSYIRSFPNHCLFISNIKRDENLLNKVSKLKDNERSNIKKFFDNTNIMLSPTVCFNCFESLKGIKIKENLKITSLSNCSRYESLNYQNLERLKIFTMRELIFFGSNKFVFNHLNSNLKYFINLFKKWNLKFRVCTASDPFFSNEILPKKIFQLSYELKYE